MGVLQANDPAIHWMGRTDPGARSVRIGFPGVTAKFRFRGVRAAVQITASTAECWLDVRLDGGDWRPVRAPLGTANIELATCADGVHEIEFLRRTEYWQGVIEVGAITVSGETMPPLPPPRGRMLFIGDSITCGANARKMSPDFPTTSIASSARDSYAMLVASQLRAEVHLIACGGRGLYRDYLGNLCDRTDTAPMFFERALPDAASAPWDHTRYQPQVVGIALGQNDFNMGIPDRDTWVEAYVAFLQRIRTVHPEAGIFLINSPMHKPKGPDAEKRAALIEYLAEAQRRFADSRVQTATVRYRSGTAYDKHPIAPQHVMIANELLPLMAPLVP